jgi:hypothetical protein
VRGEGGENVIFSGQGSSCAVFSTGIHGLLRDARDICVQTPLLLMLRGIPLGVDLTFLAERATLRT